MKKTSNTNIFDNNLNIIKSKINFFKDVIEKTIFHVNKNKLLGIFTIADVSICYK